MTPDEVLKHFKSYHYFKKETKMSNSSLWNWVKWGFVPLESQVKLERLTNGALKADLKHARPEGRDK